MQKKEAGAGSVFADLQSESQRRLANDVLKGIDAKQQELRAENKDLFSGYESRIAQIVAGKAASKQTVAELSALERGIHRAQQFKGEITDLAESLTSELQGLGQFFGNMSQYQGLEGYLARFGLHRLADRRRLSRVKSADVKQSLQTILDYGAHMVQKLYEAIIENMECYTRIQTAVERTSKALDENQPLYEQWRASRESLDRQMKDLNDKMDQSDASTVAKLEKDRAALQAKLDEAKINENNFFTVVDAMKSALPTQKTHLQSYRDMVDSLTQFRTRLDKNIENVTEIYLSTPIAIKTALGTKAAAAYDQGLKYALDSATDTVLQSVAGVLDATASRAERPLLEPEKLAEYRRRQKEARAIFETRMVALQEIYEKAKGS